MGYAYAGRFRERAAYDWSVEVSAYVDAEHHRGGIALGLYTSLFAALAVQGFHNAYAGVALPNEASIAFHLAMASRRSARTGALATSSDAGAT